MNITQEGEEQVKLPLSPQAHYWESERLLKECLTALNDYPNFKYKNGNYKNSYELASAISQHQKILIFKE